MFFWQITRLKVVLLYRRFRTTCWSNLGLCGLISCPEMLTQNNHSMLQIILGECRYHVCSGGSLKSCRVKFICLFMNQATPWGGFSHYVSMYCKH